MAEEPMYFPNLTWDAVDGCAGSGVTEMESLCMSCREQGTTKLFLTRIPYFKEVILMSFECPHCGFKSVETQTAGDLQVKGKRFNCTVKNAKSMNRQVIKSEYATIFLPELDMEIPSITQKGVCTTIEGILVTAADDLDKGQDERRLIDPETTAKIDGVIAAMRALIDARGESNFTFVLDDPSGNSHIENPHMPAKDPDMITEEYVRTAEQNEALGISQADQSGNQERESATGEVQQDEVVELPVNCSQCNADGHTRMKVTNIPHFKEIVLMSFNCEKCGYKTVEVKPGGQMAPTGTKAVLKITMEEDLSRDFLKSDTAAVIIPQFELELAPGTLGGMFTTIEGFLANTIDHMNESNPFAKGDSANADERSRFIEVIEQLEKLSKGDCSGIGDGVEIILDDPMSNSYIQNIFAPDPDPNLIITHYERTHEQNEELGLNDMHTEGDYTQTAAEIFSAEKAAADAGQP